MIIHARLCILNGLSPAQNRTIPPLDYDMVHRLVQEFPDMKFSLNGGIKTFSEADKHLGRIFDDSIPPECAYPVHSVMIGREAYNNPWLMGHADSHFFGKPDLCFSRYIVYF